MSELEGLPCPAVGWCVDSSSASSLAGTLRRGWDGRYAAIQQRNSTSEEEETEMTNRVFIPGDLPAGKDVVTFTRSDGFEAKFCLPTDFISLLFIIDATDILHEDGFLETKSRPYFGAMLCRSIQSTSFHVNG